MLLVLFVVGSFYGINFTAAADGRALGIRNSITGNHRVSEKLSSIKRPLVARCLGNIV